MNRRITLSLVLAACAASAYAESPLPADDGFRSTKTRAEVQAELAAFRQSGADPWSIAYDPLRGFQASASRAGVTADYLAAREQVRALSGEDSGSAYLDRTRAASAPGTLARLAGQ